jgi:hypothetical protein
VQEKKTTPVRISDRTKRELDKYGKFGETYDEVIWKLIKSYRISLKLKRKSEEKT